VKTLRQLDAGVARAERGVAVALLALTVTLVILQVFFRYVLNSSLSWSEEAARYLFIWAAVLGFSSSVESQRLFRFDMVAQRLPPAGAAACVGLYVVATVGFLWALIVSGGALVAGTMSQTSPAIRLPMALPYAALPVGGMLIGLHFLASLGRRASPGKGAPGRAPHGGTAA
jgi:TRAP-type C4-dicarboxylate transport system permease small subunit